MQGWSATTRPVVDVARIIEVEAYIGESDRASHARFGPTPRNRIMYGPPGHAYVYLVYGMHDCLNVVTEPVGVPAALLIRAVEPTRGRGCHAHRPRAASRTGSSRAGRPNVPNGQPPDWIGSRTHRLADGPGLVTAAFGIDVGWTGMDLCDPHSPLRIEARPATESVVVVASPRVGIDYAGSPWTERPWRFTIAHG